MKQFNNPLLDSCYSKDIKLGCANCKRKEARFFSDYISDLSNLTLGDFVTIHKGKTITEEDANTGDYPVVAGGKEPAYFNDEYNEEESAITISASGAYSGYVSFWKQKIWASDCSVIRPKDKTIHPKYLYYLLKTIQEDLYLLQTGADQPHVYPEDIAIIPFNNSVEMQDQLKLVKDVSAIEESINSLKDDIANGIHSTINKTFEEHFRFDIKSNDNKIKVEEDEFSKLSIEGTRLSYHFRHNNNILKNIYHSSNWQKLTNVFDVSGGKRIPKGNQFSLEETPYRYLRPNEVDSFKVSFEEIPYIDDDIYNLLRRYSIEKNEFAISNVGTLGKTVFIDNSFNIEEGCLILSENFAKLTPKSKINYKFYKYFFESVYFETQLQKEYTITTMKKIGIDKFTNMVLPIVEEEKQKEIVEKIDEKLNSLLEIEKRITENEKRIDETIKTFLKQYA